MLVKREGTSDGEGVGIVNTVGDLIKLLQALDPEKKIQLVAVCGCDNIESDVEDVEIVDYGEQYTLYL